MTYFYNKFNEYVKAKNKQFKGKKWSVEKAEQKLLTSKEEIEGAISVYQGVEVEDQRGKRAIDKSIRYSEKLLKDITKEMDFLAKYKLK